MLGIKCNVSQTTLLCGEKRGGGGKEVGNGAAATLLEKGTGISGTVPPHNCDAKGEKNSGAAPQTMLKSKRILKQGVADIVGRGKGL